MHSFSQRGAPNPVEALCPHETWIRLWAGGSCRFKFNVSEGMRHNLTPHHCSGVAGASSRWPCRGGSSVHCKAPCAPAVSERSVRGTAGCHGHASLLRRPPHALTSLGEPLLHWSSHGEWQNADFMILTLRLPLLPGILPQRKFPLIDFTGSFVIIRPRLQVHPDCWYWEHLSAFPSPGQGVAGNM